MKYLTRCHSRIKWIKRVRGLFLGVLQIKLETRTSKYHAGRHVASDRLKITKPLESTAVDTLTLKLEKKTLVRYAVKRLGKIQKGDVSWLSVVAWFRPIVETRKKLRNCWSAHHVSELVRVEDIYVSPKIHHSRLSRFSPRSCTLLMLMRSGDNYSCQSYCLFWTKVWC